MVTEPVALFTAAQFFEPVTFCCVAPRTMSLTSFATTGLSPSTVSLGDAR
jgi:hypothetical protein